MTQSNFMEIKFQNTIQNNFMIFCNNIQKFFIQLGSQEYFKIVYKFFDYLFNEPCSSVRSEIHVTRRNFFTRKYSRAYLKTLRPLSFTEISTFITNKSDQKFFSYFLKYGISEHCFFVNHKYFTQSSLKVRKLFIVTIPFGQKCVIIPACHFNTQTMSLSAFQRCGFYL